MAEPPAVNTTPLLVQARIGRPELLRVAGERIVVPTAVEAEVHVRGPADPAVRLLREVSWLEVVDTGPIPAQVAGLHLDAGEAAVLTWALAHPGAEVIVDDLRARRAATALSVPVRGTLGLVIDAKDQGLLRAARPVIEDLRRAGLYLSDHVVAQALTRVGE